jgi:hypothetical protein
MKAPIQVPRLWPDLRTAEIAREPTAGYYGAPLASP